MIFMRDQKQQLLRMKNNPKLKQIPEFISYACEIRDELQERGASELFGSKKLFVGNDRFRDGSNGRLVRAWNSNTDLKHPGTIGNKGSLSLGFHVADRK